MEFYIWPNGQITDSEACGDIEPDVCMHASDDYFTLDTEKLTMEEAEALVYGHLGDDETGQNVWCDIAAHYDEFENKDEK